MRPFQDVVVLTYVNFEDDHVRFDQAHSTTDGHLHTDTATNTTDAGMQMKEDMQLQPQIESDVRMDMEMGDDSMEAGFGEEADADADLKLAPEMMTVAACNSGGHATLAEAQAVAVACGCDPILAHFMGGSYMVMGCVPTMTTGAIDMQGTDHSGTNPFLDLSMLPMLSMDPADAGLGVGD
jgi:hypothetical protein